MQDIVTGSLKEDIARLKKVFVSDDTVVFREVENRNGQKFTIVFLDGMTDTLTINQSIVRPLTESEIKQDINAGKLSQVVQCNETAGGVKWQELEDAMLYGDTLVFADGYAGGLICNTKGFSTRSVSEPDSEQSLRGSREGFTESLMVNLSLIRRRLQTTDLCMEMKTIGRRSKTKITVCYLRSLVDDKILAELKGRLSKIDIDGILETNYIEEEIKDSRYSPFKTIGSTEKPDIVAARLLEGRVAVFVDGTPLVLTAPYLFIENFQSNDDYYINYFYSSISRLLRLLGYFFTITMPAIYLALVCFHKEMIPGSLLINIAKSSEYVPFSTIVEIVIMLTIFELLRETGVRMPNKLGQALSIVGGLVVGQAAVESGIVSTPVVIVVAMTGITGLLVPKLQGATVVYRGLCLVSAALLGIFGLFFALFALLIHLASISSFGVCYLEGFASLDKQKTKDIMWRAPLWQMKMRPGFAKDEVRRK